jgi:hypothetical protein
MLRSLPLFAALVLAAVPASAHAAADCRTAGHTVLANRTARVYSYQRVVYGACVYGQRNNLGVFGEFGPREVVQLEGTHLGYVVRRPGCERGDCRPDVVRVVDLRRPSAAPAQALATSYVLASDGAFAALTQPDSSGAIRVLTVAADHRTTVIASGAVAPGSLALGAGRTFYWTQDGAARSAQLPG